LIRILLADDHALMRAGFRALLEHDGSISVVGEAADGEEAVALARETRPDVILMDLSMPGIGGVEATRRILADEDLAETRILILTTFETAENVYDGLRSGASGFMLKDGDPDELIRAIRVVAAGDALLAPKVTSRLLADLAAQPEVARAAPSELDSLTDREREVMALVASGLTNRAIAEKLVVSPATAKTHVSRAMRKLHAHDRAQLVVLAYESGLVRPGMVKGPIRSAC
jgi:DNA-binding NarL/FixJ family response regulator